MNDIKRQVERIIETDPVIKKGLERGIINTRALTRWILETEGVDATPDAVLGIIRRYPLSDHESPGVSQVLGECELSLRNRVADFELEYHQNGTDPILRLAKYNGNTRSENIKLLVGSGLVRVISGQKALDNLISELLPGEVVRYSTDLAEISLRLPPRSGTRGLTAKITMELLLNDIDLWGIASFYWHHIRGEASAHSQPVTGEGLRELVLLVAETDGPRALEALQRMLKENGTNSRQSIPWTSGAPRQGLFLGLGERFPKTRVTRMN